MTYPMMKVNRSEKIRMLQLISEKVLAARDVDIVMMSDAGVETGAGRDGQWDEGYSSGQVAKGMKFGWGGKNMVWAVGQGMEGHAGGMRRIGGVAMAAIENFKARMNGGVPIKDPRGWGRWVGKWIFGIQGRKIAVITVYLPTGKGMGEDAKSKTMWDQQMRQIKEEGKEGMDPRRLALRELHTFIMGVKKKDGSTMFIIGGDWNMRWRGKDRGHILDSLSDWAATLGLVNAVRARHNREYATWVKNGEQGQRGTIDHMLVSEELRSGISKAGVLTRRRLNRSDHRLIVVDIEVASRLRIWEGLRTQIAQGKQTKARLLLSDERRLRAYQGEVVDSWSRRGLTRRIERLEMWGRKIKCGEAGGEEQAFQEELTEVAKEVAQAMCEAEVAAMGQGRQSSRRCRAKRKDGYSQEFKKKVARLRRLETLKGRATASVMVRPALATIAHMSDEHDAKARAEGVARCLGAPHNSNKRGWEAWLERVKKHIEELRAELHAKDRATMRAKVSERNAKILANVQDSRWRWILDRVFKRQRASGDKDCVVTTHKVRRTDEEGVEEEVTEYEVITDKEELGRVLRQFFANWMGANCTRWSDGHILFERSEAGRNKRLQLVRATEQDFQQEWFRELEDSVPRECREVLRWVQLKYSEVLGRRINEKDYEAAGVMQEIKQEIWDQYWAQKKSNKASDAEGKHSNLIKALRKWVQEGEEEGGKRYPPVSEGVFEDIRRLVNATVNTGMAPEGWREEVLCTLGKVAGSEAISDTRPIGLVDVLRNCVMGVR